MNHTEQYLDITASRNPNLELFINGEEVDWQSAVEYREGGDGPADGCVVFSYSPRRNIPTQQKLYVDLRSCGFSPDRMEPLIRSGAWGDEARWMCSSANDYIWKMFTLWIKLPTYGEVTSGDDSVDGRSYWRRGIPEGAREAVDRWEVVNPDRVCIYFQNEDDARLCCRTLAAFLVTVLNGDAVRMD